MCYNEGKMKNKSVGEGAIFTRWKEERSYDFI